MRLRMSTGTPIMIGGDYGGEPRGVIRQLYPDLSRTWFNRTLWDACKTKKQRLALIEEVKRIEARTGLNDEPQRLGHVEH